MASRVIPVNEAARRVDRGLSELTDKKWGLLFLRFFGVIARYQFNFALASKNNADTLM